jgi:hypothetical protein
MVDWLGHFRSGIGAPGMADSYAKRFACREISRDQATTIAMDLERGSWSRPFAGLLTDQPAITGVDVQHSLNCSSTHIMHLIECEALKLLPGTTYGKGRGRSPLIARESIADFLRARLEDSRNIIGLPSEAALCSNEIPGTPPVGTFLRSEAILTNKPTIP